MMRVTIMIVILMVMTVAIHVSTKIFANTVFVLMNMILEVRVVTVLEFHIVADEIQ